MKIAIIKEDDGYYTKYTKGNKYFTATLYNRNFEYLGRVGRFLNHPIPMETMIAGVLYLGGGTLVYTKD